MPNPNRPSHYSWLRQLLEGIAAPQPMALVKDLSSGREGTPLFVVVGACPSVFAGMQVGCGMFTGPPRLRHPPDLSCPPVRLRGDAGWLRHVHRPTASQAPT